MIEKEARDRRNKRIIDTLAIVSIILILGYEFTMCPYR